MHQEVGDPVQNHDEELIDVPRLIALLTFAADHIETSSAWPRPRLGPIDTGSTSICKSYASTQVDLQVFSKLRLKKPWTPSMGQFCVSLVSRQRAIRSCPLFTAFSRTSMWPLRADF